MEGIWFLWIKFFLSAGLVVLGGVKLTRYADLVSDKFGLNKVWIGMMLLGLITSLPELVASFASAIVFNAPNLAVGNIAGSVNFNLMIIVLMDLFYRSGSVTNQVQAKRVYNFLSDFYGILALIVAIEIFLSFHSKIFSVGHLSIGSIAIIIIYILGVRAVFMSSDHPSPSGKERNGWRIVKENIPMFGKLVFSAFVVIGGGIWLSGVCDQIAKTTTLGHTFTGTVFLGFTTSLPEIVVSIWALKLGQFELAFGNVFGSNLFNILILAICDLFDGQRSLLAKVSVAHIFMIALSVLLTTILMVGIRKKEKRTFLGLGLDSILMIICFAIGLKFLYDLTRALPF